MSEPEPRYNLAEPPFLTLKVYRQRRVKDAARFLPVCGAVLFAAPVLWAAAPSGTDHSMARNGIYIFVVWAALILVARLLAPALVRPEPTARRSDPK